MKRFPPRLLGAMSALLLAACAKNTSEPTRDPSLPPPPPSAATVNQPGEGYKLRPTDILRVEMYMEQEIKSEVSVSAEGDIALPLIDRTHVAGLTLKQARMDLTEKYKKYFKEPSLIIQIIKYAERKVYVDGFVNRPGAVLFPNEENMTISRAIAGASGIMPRGERNNVTITRTVNGKIQTIIIDMNEVSSGRAADIELQENDRVYVKDSII